MTSNGVATQSPLRRFAKGKGEIRRVFKELHEVIEATEDFLQAIDNFSKDEDERILLSIGDPDYDTIHHQKDIHQFREVVGGIGHLLERDNMKVVFTGHTSNGKSTVINSMLGDIVLPMGIGHTTHCFCSVQGTEGETYMMIGDSQHKLNITTVKQVAHALSPEAAEERHQIVNVFWDKNKCKLLSEGVVLVDTPGLDIDENYDMWIDKFCTDADVFVLVANGESTLKQTEMTFLKRVSEKLSRPNVFVLYNRWDGSDMEEDAEGVRGQHLDKAVNFLTIDLRLDVVGTDRVFFISAKEMLLHRTKGKPMDSDEAARRLGDFDRFEHNFAECISASAIRTKFEAHVVRGIDIATQLENWLSKITWTAKLQQTECRARLADRSQQLEDLDQRRDEVIARCEALVDQLGDRVAGELEAAYDEILHSRLDIIIRKFDYAIFTADTTAIYKERLGDYLGREMCAELNDLCGAEVEAMYIDTQRAMQTAVASVVQGADDVRVAGLSKSPLAASLFTAGLMDTFHEDVHFRFSLGWHALGPRLLGYSTYSVIDSILHGRPIPHDPKNTHVPTGTQVAALAVLPAASAYVPLLTLGATLAARPAVWKVVATLAGVWTALYAWERVTFTNAAKERLFKRQFTEHARTHYQHIMMQVVLNVKSHYVAGANAQLDNLRCQINERKSMLWKERGMLDRAVSRLVKVIHTGEESAQRAEHVIADLRAFSQTYLPHMHT